MEDESWVQYYRKVLLNIFPNRNIAVANGNSDDYVSLLGVLQACSDFTKPATIDEEKLLKSILSMDIELTDNEESVLKSLRKEFEGQRRSDVSRGFRSTSNGYEEMADKMHSQERKIDAQARHINVLMEQNRILLEAAKYHQQKSTLVMAMHNKQGGLGDKRGGGGGKAISANTTPLSAPMSASPGSFRQLRISTPPVNPMQSGILGSGQSSSNMRAGANKKTSNSSGSTVLSQLMTTNAGLLGGNQDVRTVQRGAVGVKSEEA